LAQAQQAHTLVLEGLAHDPYSLMGVYTLVEGKVVSGRAVWQKRAGRTGPWCMYYHPYGGLGEGGGWMVSDEAHMESGGIFCYMELITAALTPLTAAPTPLTQDRVGSSEGGGGWRVHDGADWVAAPAGVRVRRQM
jgi:hypothetical protein